VYPPALRWAGDYGFYGAIYQACRPQAPAGIREQSHVLGNIPRHHLRGSEQRKA
jgi:hypothetical protein